ncbi:hypothetical protein, partial [Actinomadura rubrisoli]
MAHGAGSAAVGGAMSGILSTGPGATNVQISLPPEALRPVTEVAAPPGLVNVPGHSQVFVGRGDELAVLRKALKEPGTVVVHGLGGV